MATVKALHIAIGARVEGFQRGMEKAKRELRSFEKSTRRARGMVVGATGAMARGFAAMGAAATIAIADSVRVFASFESSMLRIKALTGATGEEFQSLTDLAKELGSTTAFTAREAADAMGFLARAGFEVDEIMKGIPSVLNLAAAGELELATAAEIASNTLRGFGLQATEMDRVANVLAAGAAKSNTSVEALGEAFKMVSSDAKGMGLSIEETTAFLGAFANVGVKGTMGGTALRVVFAQLGEQILAQGGLLPALQSLDKDGVAAVVGAMSDLGVRAGSSAIKLANQIPVIKQLTQELQGLDNFAGNMAETMLSGMTGSFVKTGSALEGLRIQLGDTFDEFGKGFFDELTRIFGTLNEMFAKMNFTLGDLENAGKVTAQVLLFTFEGVASAIAKIIDIIGDTIYGAMNRLLEMNLMLERMSFGSVQLLSDEDLEAINAFMLAKDRRGSLLDDVESFFAELDSLLAPTAGGKVTAQDTIGVSEFDKRIDEMAKFMSPDELRQALPKMFGAETLSEDILAKILPDVFGRQGGAIQRGETVTEQLKTDTEELDRFLENMAALPEDVMMMMEKRGLGRFAEQLLASDITEGDLAKLTKLLDQSEILRGDVGIFEEVRNAILESFIDIPEAEKREPEDPVQGFTETIDTVLGAVKVDPLAGKRDSKNLDTIAKASERTARALETSGGAFS